MAARLVRLLQTASCILLPLVVSTLVGCAGGSAQRGEPRTPEGLLPQTIIDLSRQGVAPERIIAQIDETHSVYILNTAEVARLQAAGVDNRVIDHMMATCARAPKGRPLWYRQGQFYASPPFAAYTGPYHFEGKGLLDGLFDD